MDENKAEKLREIGYEIGPTCGTCKHGRFHDPASDFGTCLKHTYVHLKHTGAPRQLSVFRSGHCPEYLRDTAQLLPIVHGFKEFLR